MSIPEQSKNAEHLAELRSDVRHIQSDVTEIKTDIRSVRTELSARIEKADDKIDRMQGKIDEVIKSISSAKVWAVLLYVAMGGTLLFVMARGFKWI